LFDSISRELSTERTSSKFRGRSYRCRCDRPIYFRNSLCLACGAALGYLPERGEVRALDPEPKGTWRISGEPGKRAYRRCANFDSAAGCNWLVSVDDPLEHCIACRLNRTIPDLSDAGNRRYWREIENAKRRLVSQLLRLELPIRSKVSEDPQRGVMFDFLLPQPGGPHVLTAHVNGLITLNLEEADDAKREKARLALREPYRTLLGHLRHEIGHYYWDRLVDGTRWHEPYRELFGDERADYGAALRANYENGPPADWHERFVSSYASSHPWEDWAETWTHFLHVYDSLDTAMGFGFTGARVVTEFDPYTRDDLYLKDDPEGDRLLNLLNAWLGLTTVMNELARSMGQMDLYPFVMSRPVARKLHFIHLVIRQAHGNA